MGHYTEFRFKAVLKQYPMEPDDAVIGLLKRVLIDGDLGIANDKILFGSEDVFKPEIDHPFFQCDRWHMLLLSNNFDDKLQGGKLYRKGKYWVLDIHTEFKNYNDEISNFISWIKPYIAGRKKKQYVGYWRGEWNGEGTSPQINIYIYR